MRKTGCASSSARGEVVAVEEEGRLLEDHEVAVPDKAGRPEVGADVVVVWADPYPSVEVRPRY